MAPLSKSAPKYSKRLIPDDTVVATAIAVGGTTVSGSSIGNLVAGVINSASITDSTIDSSTIGFGTPAAAVFTQLTVGAPQTPGNVTFWGSPSSFAKWVADKGLWYINSNGNPDGGLQVDQLRLQNNTLSSINGPLVLNPTTNVVMNPETRLKFDSSDSDTGTSIFGSAAGGLQLTSTACINLRPAIAVTIPTGIPLWFDGTCSSPVAPIYRSGLYNDPQTQRMLLGGQGGIAFSTKPGTPITLTTPNTALVFGPSGTNQSPPTLQGDADNGVLNIAAVTAIDLNSPNTILPPGGHIAWNPNFSTNYITGGNGPRNQSGITIAGGDDDVRVQSNQNLVLGPAQDVIIPGAEHLLFPSVSASLGPNLTTGNLVIETRNGNSSVVLQAGSGKIAIPSGQQLQFGEFATTTQSNQSIGSGGQSILNITAPQINLNGNVVVTGDNTFVRTEQLAANDPIVQLGLDLPAGNMQDRGWMAEYKERLDPLTAFTFMGWQPTTSSFSLLSETHDDGTGHYVAGSYGDLQMGNLVVTNTITSRSGSLALNGSSIAIGDGVPLLIGTGGAGFVSDSQSVYGNVLQVLESNLQFGNTLLHGGTTTADPFVVQNASGGIRVTSGKVQLGDNANSPYFTSQSPSTGIIETITYLQNSTALQLPNQNILQWGDTLGVTSTISGNTANGSLTLSSTNTIRFNALSITGQVAWQGTPVSLQYGGTGRAGFTIDGAIPFVDLADNILNESNSLRYLSSSNTLALGSTQIRQDAILLPTTTSILTVSQGTLQLGTLASYTAADNSVSLDVYGNIRVRNRVYLGLDSADTSRYLASSSTNVVGPSDVVLGGSSLVLASSTLTAADLTTALQVRSPLTLDSDKPLSWSGNSAAQIIGLSTSRQLSLDAQGGISVPSSQARALTWNGAYTIGETMNVGFYRTANTLHYMGDSLSLDVASTLQFATSTAGAYNTIHSDTSNGLTIASGQSIRLNASQVIIDADLRVLGTTLETVSRTTILNENIFQVGQGQLLDLVSLTPFSGSQNALLVQTSLANTLQVGQYVHLTDVDAVPDVEGKYQVSSILSSTQFTVNSSITLTQNGSNGKILTPLNMDPAVDVGLQLGYYNSNPLNAFFIWQHSTQSFVLYRNGTLNNGIVSGGIVAPLTIGSLQTSTISGFTLQGPLNANTQTVSGSSFAITGGSLQNVTLDQWFTSTTSVITNLNSDRVRGLTITDFVLRDGSQSLIHDWYAGSYLITSGRLGALNCTNSIYKNNGVSNTNYPMGTTPPYLNGPVIADATTGVYYTDHAYYGYDPVLHTIISSIDVSSPQNDLYLREQQISGSKIGAGLAHCDITGNAGTVTDGVYTTDYSLANSVLVSTNGINNPKPISLTNSTVLGTDENGVTQALTGSQLNDIIGTSISYEKVVAILDPTMAPSLNLSKTLSKVSPDPNSVSNPSNGSQISYILLPNGFQEAQRHVVKGYNLQLNVTSIAIRLAFISPEDNAESKMCWIYLTNNGQSIELLWDEDEMGWYNSNAGIDILYQ